MGLRPILSSLMRNGAGALLVAIQIALTLAIVVNAVFVTSERITKMGRPSGIDDQNMFALPVTGFEKNFDFFAMVRADMAMLRDMPGVVDAMPSNHIPLSGGGSSTQFYSLPDKKGEKSPVAYYVTDEHAVNTLGVKLADGKNFGATDVEYRPKDVQGFPGTAVVTRAFAEVMFPKDKDNLVGKTMYDDQSKPIVIAGIIEQMHGAWVGWDKLDRVMLSPVVGPGPGIRYIVRTEPGKLDAVMAEVEAALRKRDPNRVVGKLRTVKNYKQSSYASDSLTAVTLSVVTGLVLVFSALGIFGLATFNVNTRTRQIGTRRAVGARRRDIVSYFMAENWLITTLGVVVGCGLALAVGFWLSNQFALPRLNLYFLVGGVAGLWALGQLAAWQPALRAAKVSPAMATRSV
ncbi:MAG TPA: FtsX-like permease family protein [Steroidobacteraceae bacterium]|nr:FtsX-like permease family protein [Steroidobacteraceae bacterium]